MSWFHRKIAVALYAAICCSRSLVGADPADDARNEVLALEAALQEVQLQLDFSCRYSLTTGTAESLDVGLAGHVDDWKINSRATGLLAKREHSLRLSVAYEGGLKKFVINPKTGQTAVSHAAFDEMSNRFVQVRYSPLQGIDYDSVFFSHRDEQTRETLQPGPLSAGIVTPFSPLTSFGTPLLLPIQKSEASKAATTTFEVFANEDGSLTIIARSELPGRWRQERRGIVQFFNGLPAMREMTWEIVATNKSPPFVSRNHVLFRDYEQNIPTQVLTVHANPGGTFLCHLWKRIGPLSVPADPDAFTIEVAKTTKFSGLNGPIPALDTRRIRLDDISPGMIGDQIFGSQPLQTPMSRATSDAPQRGMRLWLMIVNTLVGLLIVGVALYRRHRNMKNNETSRGHHP